MPVFFNEEQARAALEMDGVIGALREAFLAQANGRVSNVPRSRAKLLGKSLNITAASDADQDRYGVKIYGGGVYHILLYARDGGLLATMEADWLGQLRTGGTNGLAASLMARPQSTKVGLIGAGRQAVAQLLALESVGLMREVHVFARRREQAEAFCMQMEGLVKAKLHIAASAEAAVAQADIVVTATSSATPVVQRAWLKPGVHVNAMGANAAARMELDPAIIADASLVVTDDVDQARHEAAEFLHPDAAFDWARLQPLHALVRAGRGARAETDISVFKSLGAGLEDLAIASLLYDRCTGVR